MQAYASTTQFGDLLQQQKDSLFYLNKSDRRMRFNNSKDPIYFAFYYLSIFMYIYIFKQQMFYITVL